MKTNNLQQSFLVIGLFVALALNISGLQINEIQVAAHNMDEGEISLSIIDREDRVFVRDSRIDSSKKKNGATKSATVKVKLGNGKSQKVTIRAREVISQKELTDEQRQRSRESRRDNEVRESRTSLDDRLDNYNPADTATTSSAAEPDGDYSEYREGNISTNRLRKLQEEALNKRDELNKDVQNLLNSGQDLDDAAVKAKIRQRDQQHSEANNIRNYIDEYRTNVKVEVIDLPEGFFDLCTGDCNSADILDDESNFLNLSKLDDVDLMDTQSFVASLSDFENITEAVESMQQVIKDRNSDNAKKIRKLKKDIEARKKCKLDADLETKITSKNKEDCWMDLLASLQNESEPWLYENDEDKRTRLMKTVYAGLKPYFKKGSPEDREDKIAEALDIFDVDVDGNDYDVYMDESTEPIVGNLLVEKYIAQTYPEIRQSAMEYSQARYYGKENKQIKKMMESVFERNGINGYVNRSYIDASSRDSARILSNSAVDMYCGALTNMNPNYSMAMYDYNCINASRNGRFATGQEILSELEYLRSTGADSMMARDDNYRGRTQLDDRYDFDRNMTSRNRRPLDGNLMAGRSLDRGRRLGMTQNGINRGSQRGQSRRGGLDNNGRFDWNMGLDQSLNNNRGMSRQQGLDPRFNNGRGMNQPRDLRQQQFRGRRG